jgi:hypothetical protein
MAEREDPGGEVGGRVARLRARLTRAIRSPGADGAAALLAALRDYVRAAREAGLGARSVLADVDRAWRRGAHREPAALTRDVLEVATLLELGAGDVAPSSRPR